MRGHLFEAIFVRTLFLGTIFGLSIVLALSGAVLGRGSDRDGDEVARALDTHQYDMSDKGRSFLAEEARNSQFFVLGELHGDKEIPALLRALWPEMWNEGFRYIGAEVSPWAAHQLESVPAGKGPDILGLWTNRRLPLFACLPVEPMRASFGAATWRKNSRSF